MAMEIDQDLVLRLKKIVKNNPLYVPLFNFD